MNSFLKKWKESLLELSFSKGIALLGIITGITVASVAAFARDFFSKVYSFSVLQIFIFFVIEVIVILIFLIARRKFKNKQKFKEGTKVTLSTNHSPVMSVGKYNFFTNKVFCSWSLLKEIKGLWIDQDQLVEYIQPEIKPANRNKGNGRSLWNY